MYIAYYLYPQRTREKKLQGVAIEQGEKKDVPMKNACFS